MLIGSEGGLRLRVSAVPATLLRPTHQAFSVAFPAFAVAAACLGLGVTVSGLVAAALIAAAG